jgi:predicted RNA-binding protein YlxR (DUF448 family)
MLAAQDITQDNELDAGPRSSGSGTERFCAVTRTVKPVDELIRFVVGPDEGVVPDLKRKLPGRGLWITADKKNLADAIARKVFARGFKREVKVPVDLSALTEQLLTQSALDALAIAGKARLVSAGFSKTEAALMRDRVAGLLHASEAAADGVKKLTGVLKSRPDVDRIPVVKAFNSAQLDLALGRSNVVHAALLAGPPSDTFLARFQRLERFRTGNSGESGASRTPN